MARKCIKCGKPPVYFTMVLLMGPRGFRRYPVCDKCKAKVEKVGKIVMKVPDKAATAGD